MGKTAREGKREKEWADDDQMDDIISCLLQHYEWDTRSSHHKQRPIRVSSKTSSRLSNSCFLMVVLFDHRRSVTLTIMVLFMVLCCPASILPTLIFSYFINCCILHETVPFCIVERESKGNLMACSVCEVALLMCMSVFMSECVSADQRRDCRA